METGDKKSKLLRTTHIYIFTTLTDLGSPINREPTKRNTHTHTQTHTPGAENL